MAFGKTQEFLLPGFVAIHLAPGGRYVGLRDLNVRGLKKIEVISERARNRWCDSVYLIVSQHRSSDFRIISFDPIDDDGDHAELGDVLSFARALGWKGPIYFEHCSRGQSMKGVVHAEKS